MVTSNWHLPQNHLFMWPLYTIRGVILQTSVRFAPLSRRLEFRNYVPREEANAPIPTNDVTIIEI